MTKRGGRRILERVWWRDGHCRLAIPTEPDSAARKPARKRWANLIRHIYEVDPLVCPRCGGAMKIISFITEQRVIRAILDSVQRTGTPSPAGSLHPPPPARPAGNGLQ
jgi:hypothetical protein